MEHYQAQEHGFILGRVAGYVAVIAVLAAGGIGGYAIHEHHMAQKMAMQNEQVNTALSATRNQVEDLTAKVNTLAARSEQQPQPAPVSQPATARRTVAPRRHSDDPRLKKLQSQVDAQGRAIDETRNDLATTRGDLSSTRTELTGSIAHTHDELVLLQKKGERNYYEFDVDKSKQFQHDGPFGIRLKKANTKHQYADLELMVDDRDLSQKHVNLYQPLMFYTPDSPQAVEVVINTIGKDHIHGYISAPKYRQSELASMSNNGGNTATDPNHAPAASNTQAPARQKLAPPQ
jgi:hypothetical protein